MKHIFATFIGVTLLAGLVMQPTVGFAQSGNKYTIDKEWAKLPPGMTWDASTSSIAPDGKGNVIVLVRKAPFFRVFSRDGKFLKAWGDDPAMFKEAHSLTFDRDGMIWATDSQGHVVYKFTPEGKLLLTLGKMGVAGDDASRDLFNRPNAVALAPNGDIYISDGYVSSRVVQYSRDGKFVRIIGGKKGAEPGQLQLPHGVVLDSKGRIIVGDSDNKRISVFDKDGRFVENWAFPSRGGMLIQPDDTIYASDVNIGAVNILKDGKLVNSITRTGHGRTGSAWTRMVRSMFPMHRIAW